MSEINKGQTHTYTDFPTNKVLPFIKLRATIDSKVTKRELNATA